ncbi:hypothetical protein ACFY0N_00545 [Streptomyces vinaceus]|uniref:hypothetical protein n=1 Tax=Streptomyces vinaceus TaxID=1960 RepID=UPI003687665C
MRATIRQNSLANLHADVDAAMAQVDIDDSGTYLCVNVVTQPGEPTERSERTMPGHEVRATLRIQLQLMMHEIEQVAPLVIEARWTRQSKRNDYRTRSCTYTRIPAPSLDVPSAPESIPAPTSEPIPAHVTQRADEIELVAEAGDPEDALDLSRQLVRAGHAKLAIDVRRAVTGGALDRDALRALAAKTARQLREDYEEAHLLAA